MKKNAKRVNKILFVTMLFMFVTGLGAWRMYGVSQNPPRQVSTVTQQLHSALANTTEVQILAGDFYSQHVSAQEKEPRMKERGALLLRLRGSEAKKFVRSLELYDFPPDPEPKVFNVARSCLCQGSHEIVFYNGKKRLDGFFFLHEARLRSQGQMWDSDMDLSEKSLEYVLTVLKGK